MSKEHSGRTGDIPQEISNILASDNFLLSLPKIDDVLRVSGGVAHQVFQINAGANRYYLKIRGDRFASIPEIVCDPKDIEIEYRALKLLHQATPDNFPKVFNFNQDKHYLILEDAIPNGEKLEDLFLKEKTIPQMFFNFGQTLAKIHEASSSYRKPVRGDGDQIYYKTVLGHRFGYRNNPILNALIESLSVLDNKQLILGDVSPKNIGVNNDGKRFMFFDLETAHQGDVVFDYSYFLGHILIHNLTSSSSALADVAEYIKGYGDHGFEDIMVKRMALGTMLYRLRSIVPYPTKLNTSQTVIVERKIESILPYDLTKLDWSKTISLIRNE